MVEYYGVFLYETNKAILFVHDEQIKQKEGKLIWDPKDEIWLPKSQIQYDDGQEYKKEDPIVVEIPDWLAKSKGLI